MKNKKRLGILKFAAAVFVLTAIILSAVYGLIPSSELGGVIGHNMANKIDATPLIYTDSEDMPRLEEDVMDCLKRVEVK